MVGTIIPIVHGGQHNGWQVLRLHVAAYIIGATVLGASIASFGLLFGQVRIVKGSSMAVIGLVSLFCAAREFGLITIPFPESRWQVPASWRNFSPTVMATLYGLVLGVGVANRTRVSTLHVAVLWASLTRNPLLAAAALSGFGVGRAIPIIWITCRSKNTGNCLSVAESITRFFPTARALNGLILTFAGFGLLAAWMVGTHGR
jgi:hypothetical protein